MVPGPGLEACQETASQDHWPSGIPTAAVDLHCHSTFSEESLHFLPGLVWRPVLTPGQTYDLAKSRGMDFVTITDHDTIDGCLALLDERGTLDDFIIGEEISTAFPEDGTGIHVNVFDIDETQHAEIQRLRGNVYELVSYLRAIDRLYVLNHMSWTEQHRMLKPWQVERMLELFDVFEGLNGTRSYAHNDFTRRATTGRGKTLVGGSDSHTCHVGTTYTRTLGATRVEVLASIRAGYAVPCGGCGTPEKLRDDVTMMIQKNVERRLAQASTFWEQFAIRAVRRFGQIIHPALCRGYHRHQDFVIRSFGRELPA